MQRIIGGVFALEVDLGSVSRMPPFLGNHHALLVNARSALRVLRDALQPGRAWLPAYLCSSLLQAFEDTPTHLEFYPLDEHLRTTEHSWIEGIESGDLVVLIDYFGFPCDERCAAGARARGAFVVEDASQALLTEELGLHADAVLYSPRKFLGVPDGGVLALREAGLLEELGFAAPASRWWRYAHAAVEGRRHFDRCGGGREWLEHFQTAERTAPCGAFAMSEKSRDILARYANYAETARARIANYRRLAERLGEFALRPTLPDGVVPLGFPVRLRERDRVRQACFENEIYPPIHWPRPAGFPADRAPCSALSRQLMTLPCDQRYDRTDMDRMAGVISAALSGVFSNP